MNIKVGDVAIVNVAQDEKVTTNRPCLIFSLSDNSETVAVLPILQASKKKILVSQLLIRIKSSEGSKSGLPVDSVICNVVCYLPRSRFSKVIGHVSNTTFQQLAEMPLGDPCEYD
jgi:hypothetical protein